MFWVHLLIVFNLHNILITKYYYICFDWPEFYTFYGNYVYRNMEEKTVKYGVSPTFSDFSKNQTGELIVVEEKQDHDVMSLLGRKVEFKTFLHVPNPESQYIS